MRPIAMTLLAFGGAVARGGGSIPFGITRIFAGSTPSPRSHSALASVTGAIDVGRRVRGARQAERQPRRDVALARRRRGSRAPSPRYASRT